MQVIEAATGKVLEDYQDNNLVVTLGKTNTAKLLAGDAAGKIISKISVGTGDADPIITDTGLTGAYTKAITSYTFPESNSVLFSWSIDNAEANGMSIKEFGLLTADNVLFARKVRSEIVKTSAVRLVGTWKIIIN